MSKIKNNVSISQIEVETNELEIQNNQEKLRQIIVNMLFNHIKSNT